MEGLLILRALSRSNCFNTTFRLPQCYRLIRQPKSLVLTSLSSQMLQLGGLSQRWSPYSQSSICGLHPSQFQTTLLRHQDQSSDRVPITTWIQLINKENLNLDVKNNTEKGERASRWLHEDDAMTFSVDNRVNTQRVPRTQKQHNLLFPNIIPKRVSIESTDIPKSFY